MKESLPQGNHKKYGDRVSTGKRGKLHPKKASFKKRMGGRASGRRMEGHRKFGGFKRGKKA